MENLFIEQQGRGSDVSDIEIHHNNAGVLRTTVSAAFDLGMIGRNSPIVENQSEAQSTLFVPFLGQSNAQHMSIIYDPYQPGVDENNTSGALTLQERLRGLTNNNIVTSSTSETNFAVGGSKVNGNGRNFQEDNLVWWYPDQNQPGGALRQAEQGLVSWFSDNGAQPTDEIAIIWSQGESDVGDIYPNNSAAKEAYKQSTISVFDYLTNNLGYENITFYLVPTGRLQEEGAANVGLNAQEIGVMNESLGIIQEAQSEIARERDDVQLAPSYSDLNMVYEEGLIYGESYDQDYAQWSRDFWHLGHDGLKINGDRLAEYIALDRGENNVISFTDSFGNPAQSIALTRDGILDINITENSNSQAIGGTQNPDLIVGSAGADEIFGRGNNDVIVATSGLDTLSGGNGDDVFFYRDATAGNDRIVDFTPGSDRLDISELLTLSAYGGSDPIADGYVVLNSLAGNSLEIQFDSDGMGEQTPRTLAVLENIDFTAFQSNLNQQFIFTPTEF